MPINLTKGENATLCRLWSVCLHYKHEFVYRFVLPYIVGNLLEFCCLESSTNHKEGKGIEGMYFMVWLPRICGK